MQLIILNIAINHERSISIKCMLILKLYSSFSNSLKLATEINNFSNFRLNERSLYILQWTFWYDHKLKVNANTPLYYTYKVLDSASVTVTSQFKCLIFITIPFKLLTIPLEKSCFQVWFWLVIYGYLSEIETETIGKISLWSARQSRHKSVLSLFKWSSTLSWYLTWRSVW